MKFIALKKYSFGYGDLSASCTYEFDQTLSIPKDVLVKLNDTDFYSNEISDEVNGCNQHIF